MKQRIFALLLLLGLIFSLSATAAPPSAEPAAGALLKMGLFNGSAAGFRLNDRPTRAEATVMLVRLSGLEGEMDETAPDPAPFSDVADTAWYAPYISLASARGLVRGMGNGCFAPEQPVTVQQYAAMLLAALDRPAEYSLALASAKDAGIFDYVSPSAPFTRGDLVLMSFGALHAVTGEGEPLLSRLLSQNAVSVSDLSSEDFSAVPRINFYAALEEDALTLSIGGRSLSTGTDSALLTACLGERNRIDTQNPDLCWHVFTGDYTAFVMVAVSDGEAVGFYTNSRGASLSGVTVGDPPPAPLPEFPDRFNVTVFSDSETGAVDGILALPKKLSLTAGAGANALRLGRELFDMACAARVGRGKSALSWSDAAADAALSHSRAMSAQHFFGHRSPDGENSGDRLAAAGVSYARCGENIAQGFGSVFAAHHGWMDSPSHRATLLDPKMTHFGAAATGDLYYTSVFFTPSSPARAE